MPCHGAFFCFSLSTVMKETERGKRNLIMTVCESIGGGLKQPGAGLWIKNHFLFISLFFFLAISSINSKNLLSCKRRNNNFPMKSSSKLARGSKWSFFLHSFEQSFHSCIYKSWKLLHFLRNDVDISRKNMLRRGKWRAEEKFSLSKHFWLHCNVGMKV